jgi:hypothetical protein
MIKPSARLLRALSTTLFCLTLTGVADAVAPDGAVVGWGRGSDFYGQSTPPDIVNGVSGTAIDIAAGGSRTLAIVAPPPYSTSVPTGHLRVTLDVTDGVTTATIQLLAGGVRGAAFGEMIGILSPVLGLSALTFEVLDGGTVTDLLGSAEIPVTLTIDPETLWEYQSLDPAHSTVDPELEREIATGDVTTFALSGEVELLGELIPFSFTRTDVNFTSSYPKIVDSVIAIPHAVAPSPALPSFLCSPAFRAGICKRGEISAQMTSPRLEV